MVTVLGLGISIVACGTSDPVQATTEVDGVETIESDEINATVEETSATAETTPVTETQPQP